MYVCTYLRMTNYQSKRTPKADPGVIYGRQPQVKRERLALEQQQQAQPIRNLSFGDG